jgi:hypothetical protein
MLMDIPLFVIKCKFYSVVKLFTLVEIGWRVTPFSKGKTDKFLVCMYMCRYVYMYVFICLVVLGFEPRVLHFFYTCSTIWLSPSVPRTFSFSVFFFSGGIGFCSQGITLARQAFFHLDHSSSQMYIFLIIQISTILDVWGLI